MHNEPDRLFFQNPSDGYPMVVVQRGKHPLVVVCDDGDESFAPSTSTMDDAVAMNAAITAEKITDTRAAARFLQRRFGAEVA